MRQLAAILVLLFVPPLFAADDPPRFLIERIDVRNTHHASPAIIRAETRLNEGRSYTEGELREASYRVARLPFVLDAEYSLEKGSRRDAFIFVITVTETKPLFFDLDLNAWLGPGEHSGTSDAVVGGRMFAGSRGVFHGAAGTVNSLDDHSSGGVPLQVGYTQYDLFGTRAFANIDVTRYFGFSYSTHTPEISVLLGVPLGDSQTITGSIDRSESAWGTRTGAGVLLRNTARTTTSALNWTYNTTDSPFFPTRGEIVTLGASRARTRMRSEFPNENYSATEFDLTAAKYWQLSDRDSISARLSGMRRATVVDSNFEVYPGAPTHSNFHSDYETFTLDLSHSLFDQKQTRAVGDNRIDAAIGATRYITYRTVAITEPLPASFEPQLTHRIRPNVGAWWARRTAWGLLRIGGTYQW